MILRRVALIAIVLFSNFKIYGEKPIVPSQPSDPGDVLTLSLEELMEVMISTGSKKEQSIAEMPASVVIISRDEINTFGYQNLDDLIADVTGFYPLGNANLFGVQNFGVRGFSSVDYFNNVMIMVNGVNQMEDYYNTFTTNKVTVPIQAIDRVEVVRGPAAVTYGSNAFMGVINIITDDASNGGKNSLVSGSYGSLNTVEGSLRLAGADTLKSSGKAINYSFNAGWTRSDGLSVPYDRMQSDSLTRVALGIESETTEGRYDFKNNYFNFSADYENFFVRADHSVREEGVPGPLPALPNTDFPVSTIATNFQVGYKRNFIDRVDIEFKYTNSNYNTTFINNTLVTRDFYTVGEISTQAHGFELVSNYQISDDYSLTFGVEDRLVSQVEVYFDAPLAQIYERRVETDGMPRINTFSTFLQSDFKFFDKLHLVAGLRLEKNSNYSFDITGGTEVPGQLSTFKGAVDIGKALWIPRVALVYDIGAMSALKLMYSQSQKRPAFAEQFFTIIAGDPSLDFSQMDTYELNYIGLPLPFLGVNASVFYNQLDNLVQNQIVLDENNNANVGSVNQGKVNTIGTEVTLKFDLMDNLVLETSVTYQESEDKTPGYEGEDFAQSPNWLGYGKLSYGINEFVKVGMKARYVGEMVSEFDLTSVLEGGLRRATQPVSDYFLLDANIYAELHNGFYSSLLISNLLDTEVMYVSNFNNRAWADQGIAGYGTRARFTLGYRF